MRIVRDYQYTRPGDRGASVAIGNFDGVHLGHQAVIGLALQAVPTAPLGVLTFEPHPREFFAPDAPSFRLMSAEARTARLEKLGVDVLYQLNFNTAMASLSPREFAERVICKGLGLVNVVVGADFCFGKGRQPVCGRRCRGRPSKNWSPMTPPAPPDQRAARPGAPGP